MMKKTFNQILSDWLTEDVSLIEDKEIELAQDFCTFLDSHFDEELNDLLSKMTTIPDSPAYNIEFQEQYIHEKPKENYWRGITATVNGIRILDIWLDERNSGDILYISLDSGLIPNRISRRGQESIELLREYDGQINPDTGLGGCCFLVEDKELVKARAMEIINRYFSLFK
jgi:hypothetical protein